MPRPAPDDPPPPRLVLGSSPTYRRRFNRGKNRVVTTAAEMADRLQQVDRMFGIDKVLADRGKDLIEIYYEQSGPAYDRLLSASGAMHLALTMQGSEPRPEDYRAQPTRVVGMATNIGASRILELGCGKGFNATHVARALPDRAVLGTDLLPAHVETARRRAAQAGLSNLQFEIASFEDLPPHLTGFDLAFAVETLCYARDLDKVAQGLARALNPGGRVLIYDVHALTPPETWSAAMTQAVRLYETAMAVTRGFHAAGAWEAALERAGLAVRNVVDHSARVQPGLRQLESLGDRVVTDWKKRSAVTLAPRYMARNLIAALLGPHVYAVPEAGRDGPLAYQMIIAEKPRLRPGARTRAATPA